jgi:hypothetical protein
VVVVPSVARDELIATLEATLAVQQRLVAAARDHALPVADLLAQLTILERLDGRRDQLISQLRQSASAAQRECRAHPPIRQVILAALRELGGWPQNAGFLASYLWASRQLHVDSRAFAPLRRDERRSWQRSPGARPAYLVPALNCDGSANPRWLTSSAWDLDRRVVASADSLRLFDLQKVRALATAPAAGLPMDALLCRCTAQVFGQAAALPALPVPNGSWRRSIAARSAALISRTRQADDPRRARIARELAGLPEGDRLWGRPHAASGRPGLGTPASGR